MRAGRPKKTCPRCGVEKPADTFARICRDCQREAAHDRYVQVTYGITGKQYRALFEAQDGRCYICRHKPKTKHLPVDHDHKTGEVRGLLCDFCNHRLLGAAHDDPEILRRALDYVENPPAREVLNNA